MGDELIAAVGSEGTAAAGGGPGAPRRVHSASLDVDDLIGQLLSVRGKGPSSQVNLPEDDIRSLCLVARDVLLDQPCLLQLATPIKICGDIHGQYHDLLRLFDYGGHPPSANYLFLGDYVDRGKRSLETICLLMCYKVKYPNNFFILRGNHESASINKMYGFYDECKRRYSAKLWKTFTDCFNCLPVAAIVDDKIFCAHGGLSPELNDMEQVNRISRPTDVPDTGLLCDLLWSDPDSDIIGWGENDRGVSFTFGEDIVRDFLAAHDLDLICRAHQVVEDGYEFFAKRRLVTLFSAPNYCGEFNNAGAMMSVNEALMCSFQILQSTEPKERYQRKSSSANRSWLTNGPVGGTRLLNNSSGWGRAVEDPLLGPLPDDVNKRGNRSSSPPAAGPLHSSGDSGGGVGGTIRSMPKFAGEMGVTASIAAAAAAATARATASSVATPIPANEEGRAGGRSVDNGEGGGRARKGRRARHMSPIQVAAGRIAKESASHGGEFDSGNGPPPFVALPGSSRSRSAEGTRARRSGATASRSSSEGFEAASASAMDSELIAAAGSHYPGDDVNSRVDDDGVGLTANESRRPSSLPAEGEEVVEEGKIGGDGAGQLETRKPAVRLPPPAASPLSGALATKGLATIDGVRGGGGGGGSAGRGFGGPAIGSGGLVLRTQRTTGGLVRSNNRGRRRRSAPSRQQSTKNTTDRGDILGAEDNVEAGVRNAKTYDDARRRRQWLQTAGSRRGDGKFRSFGGTASGGVGAGTGVGEGTKGGDYGGGAGGSTSEDKGVEVGSGGLSSVGVRDRSLSEPAPAIASAPAGVTASSTAVVTRDVADATADGATSVTSTPGRSSGGVTSIASSPSSRTSSSVTSGSRSSSASPGTTSGDFDLERVPMAIGGVGAKDRGGRDQQHVYLSSDDSSAEMGGSTDSSDAQDSLPDRVGNKRRNLSSSSSEVTSSVSSSSRLDGEGELYQSGEVDGTRGGRRALRGNQRRARAREEAKAKAAAGASSSSLSGAPAPVEAEDNDTEWEMVNRTPASAYGFKTPPSNTALSADLPVSGSSVNSTSTRPTREGNSGFPASADADAGAGGRGNVPSSSSLRRSSGGGRSPEMSGAVATIPAPAARVAPITNGVSTGESSRTKSGKPAELLSEALTAVHREQRHQRRTLENRGDDERVGVAERSAAETQAAPGFERAPAAAATTATTATSASDASPHDDRIRGAEAKKMKEVIASATPTTAASGTASTDLDDSGRRGSGARATGYGAWRRRGGDGTRQDKTSGLDWSRNSSTISGKLDESNRSNRSIGSDSAQSLTESETARRKGMLGSVKKGVGAMWSKVVADHPEPLPVDKNLSKGQQRALHYQLEKERRNNWQTNSIGEQYQMRAVLKYEEEKVWH